MRIGEVTASRIDPVSEASPLASSSARPDDIAFFYDALEQSDNPSSKPTSSHHPDLLFNKAFSMFDQLDKDSKGVDKVLRNASRSTDPLVLTQIDDKLSQYYLESSLNAKLVSKTVQGLEKLTNLQ